MIMATLKRRGRNGNSSTPLLTPKLNVVNAKIASTRILRKLAFLLERNKREKGRDR